MFIHEFAALAAAACWTLAGLVSATPSQYLGAIAFNRARMLMVFAGLAAWVTIAGSWGAVGGSLGPLVLSGFIGIFIGDTALFLTLNRLGPRRTAILFSLNAPLAAVLGWLALGEVLSPQAVVGIVVTFAGVLLSIAFGKRPSQLHIWEDIKGPLWVGALLGITAALAQAVGSLIARPVMEAGIDPIAASAVRVGTAALGLMLLMQLPSRRFRPINRLTVRSAWQIALSGLLGMGLGMTLLLFALAGGEVGIVATLSATTPALQLPLIWARTGEVPAAGAWVGAGVVVVGSALLFWH